MLELKDGTNAVTLYNVETSHMKAALFAYVPRDRTLIQADLFDDGWQQQPWGDTMLEAIAARKLPRGQARPDPRAQADPRRRAEDAEGDAQGAGGRMAVLE